MDKEKPQNPTFTFTWKVMAAGIGIFLLIRALLWFLEGNYQLGLGPLGQAIIAGVFGTLAMFMFAKSKADSKDGSS